MANPEIEAKVEEFLQKHDVDPETADLLRSAGTEVQEAVLKLGGLPGVQPSTVLKARINSAKKVIGRRAAASGSNAQASTTASKKRPHPGEVDDSAPSRKKSNAPPPQTLREQLTARPSGPPAPGALAAAARAAPKPRGSAGQPRGSIAKLGKASVDKFRGSALGASSLDAEVEKFLQRNGIVLDPDGASATLTDASPQVKEYVIELGDLPSKFTASALMRRVGAAERALGEKSGPQYASKEAVKAGVEAFLKRWEVDDAAANALRQAPVRVQEVVLDRGRLSGCRNPSGALMSRIRTAEELVGESSWEGWQPESERTFSQEEINALDQKIVEFLAKHVIDEKAADMLWNSRPIVKEEVLRRGPIPEDARNPSGMLTSRIVLAERQSPEAKKKKKLLGGWAPMWHDNNVWEESSGITPEQLRDEVDRFLEQDGIDEKAMSMLREARPEIQITVLDRGGVKGTQKPSSVIASRIFTAEKEFKTNSLKEAQSMLSPSFWEKPGKEGCVGKNNQQRCPICQRKLVTFACACIGVPSPPPEEVYPVLVDQVKTCLKGHKMTYAAWEAFVNEKAPTFQRATHAERVKPSFRPDQYEVDFLVRFLRTQSTQPLAQYPEAITLYGAMIQAESISEILDLCNEFQEGIQNRYNLLMALLLIYQYSEISKGPGQIREGQASLSEIPPPLMVVSEQVTSDRRIFALISLVMERIYDFNREQFMRVIQTMAKMGVRGMPLRAMIDPAIGVITHLKPEGLAQLAYAFDKMLGYESAPLMKEIIPAAIPVLSEFGLRKSLSLVSSLMRSQVVGPEAQELFKKVADDVATKPKEANAAIYIQALAGYAELGIRHDGLQDVVAKFAMQDMDKLYPASISEIARIYWMLNIQNEKLMKKLGEVTSRRISEFDREQLQAIECAYGAAGFTIPDEWYEQYNDGATNAQEQTDTMEWG